MNEQEICPVSVCYTSESNIPCLSENQSCHNSIERIRGHSKSLRILEQFRHIYEDRLRKIDEEPSVDGMELKLKTLTSWINDLGEQNLMLVETVEELEREAADRVALLEERLKKSSHIALEYMSKLEEYDNQFLDSTEEKTPSMVLPINTSSRLAQAQQTEEILKIRVSNLQNDISGLLELIRRARFEGTWDTNGLSFLEVTYEDIFGSYPHQVSDNLETLSLMQTTVNMLHQKLGKAVEDYHGRDQLLLEQIRLLQEQIASQQSDIALKEVQIKNFIEKIQELQSNSCDKSKKTVQEKIVVDTAMMTIENTGEQETSSRNRKTVSSGTEELEVSVLTKKLEDSNLHLQMILKENERLMKEIKFLSSDLKSKTDKIDVISQSTTQVDKNEVESRISDLEMTYLRLESSWEHAWEELETFNLPEKISWCTPTVKKDQERIRNICGNLKMLLQSQQQDTVQRGVSFASPTKEDYKLQVQELQKALKQAQNGAELARKQITRNNECLNDEVQFARHIEECRVNVVLAQAAIEETVEELETLVDNLRGREEKIHELEILIQCLQNSLTLSLQEINNLLKPVINNEEKINNLSRPFLSYSTKVRAVTQLLKSLRNECMSCDGIVGNGPVMLNTTSGQENIPQSNFLKETNSLIEEVSQLEVEVSQRYLEVNNVQGKLHGLHSEIKAVQIKINEYVQDKETTHNHQVQNEQKIKKLLLELESVQEDLEQCLKTFQSNDTLDSDIE